MTKNPVINAMSASVYIILVVMVMTFVAQSQRDKPDNAFLIPIVMLSVLTLSVSVMAFVFFYQPLLFFIEGKKKEAVRLFSKTVGFFAIFTVAAVILLLALKA